MANPVNGTNSPETLNGTAGDDIITALGGDDRINASTGIDMVDGGEGSDWLAVGPTGNAPPGTVQNYTVVDGHVSDSLGRVDTSFTSVERINISEIFVAVSVDASGFTGRLSVNAAGNSFAPRNDSVIGGSGDDLFVTSDGGLDTFDGGDGVDFAIVTLPQYSPNATFAEEDGAIVVDSGGRLVARNVERFSLSASNTPMYVDASAVDVAITFNLTSQMDIVVGSTGANLFVAAHASDDVLVGSGGVDTYLFTAFAGLRARILDLDSDDRIDLTQISGAKSFIGTDAFTGVAGQYRVYTFHGETMVEADSNGDGAADYVLTIANGAFTLSETEAGSNVLHLTGTAPPPDPGDNVLNGGSGPDRMEGGEGNDTLSGNGGDDLIHGDQGDDTLSGGDDNDELYGEDGEDALDGGAGRDRLSGGAGDDTLVDMSGEDQYLEGGDGDDVINVAGAAPSLYFDTSVLGGAGNDRITAANGSYAIFGDGNDSGGDADDGDGNDVILLANSRSLSRVDGGDGDDAIFVSGTDQIFVMGGTGSDDITVQGSYYNAEIHVEEQAGPEAYVTSSNVVRLRGGNAELFLGGVRDVVRIETDGRVNILLQNFRAGEEGHLLDLTRYGADPFGSGALTIAEVSDFNGVRTVITHAATGSTFTLVGLRPGDLSAYNVGVANSLYAPSTALTLTGMTDGPDADYRRAGMDAGDLIAGFDGDDLLLGAGGNDTLRGGAGQDSLKGGTGSDRLEGGADDDSLDGGKGEDRMEGGAGDDTYFANTARDAVVESAGAGTDRVYALVSYELGANVENLELIGVAGINGAGNGLANVLAGNDGNNWLVGLGGNDVIDGGGGVDRMDGGLGDDSYRVDNAADWVNEKAGEGIDLVYASVSYTLGANVEDLILTGGEALGGAGNALANRITGNGGANRLAGREGDDVLDGGAGADRLEGGSGNDRYIVDNAGDVVVEAADGGADTVEAWISYTLGANVESLVLMGSAAIDGTGNAAGNKIFGNGASNVLSGGAGTDAFVFNTALGSGNVDTLADFVVKDDTIHLDRTIFAGIAADGALAAGAFVLGTAAVDADDRILYDAATGNIWYDADGVGGAAAVQFARVTAGLALTNADFFAVP